MVSLKQNWSLSNQTNPSLFRLLINKVKTKTEFSLKDIKNKNSLYLSNFPNFFSVDHLSGSNSVPTTIARLLIYCSKNILRLWMML